MARADIILRNTWGARWGYGWTVRNLPATSIWLHHPVTGNLPSTATPAQEHADMRLIEDIGRQRFRYADFTNGVEKWALPSGSGISYSYVVYRSGRIYQGHRLDRFSSHTAGYNSTGIGIAVQGNTDQMDMTPEQVDAVARLLVRLKADGVATQARLAGGHRDTGFATSCPGNYAYRRIAEINALAARYERGADVPPVTPPPVAIPQPDPNVRRAQAALNYLIGAGLAEDGWAGVLTNGADNRWRELDPSTPSMTPPDRYADYLEATVNAIARIEAKVDAVYDDQTKHLHNRTVGTLRKSQWPVAGNATFEDMFGAIWMRAGKVDPDALAAALAKVPGGASIDAGQLADALADELAQRLTGTAGKEAV